MQGGIAAQSGLVALVQPPCQEDHSLVELLGGKGVVLEWFEFSGHSTAEFACDIIPVVFG